MKLIVNGAAEDYLSNLNEVIKRKGYTEGRSVATAVNGVFVPFTQRDALELKAGDRVEILLPMSGG